MWVIPPSISSAFAPEQVVLISEFLSQNPERGFWAMSSGKPTLRPYCWRGWQSRAWTQRLFGAETLPTSTCDHTEAISTWLSLATRASPIQWQGRALEPTTTDGCSTGFSKSSIKAGLILSSGKTSRGTRTDSLPLSSQDWKEWAASLRLEYSARRKSAPVTGGSDCSSWPTATNGDSTSGQTRPSPHRQGGAEHESLRVAAAMWPTARSEDSESSGERKSRGVADTLTAASRQWATPNTPAGGRSMPDGTTATGKTPDGRKVTVGLENQVKQWPTPAARDHKGSLPLGQRDRTMGTLDEAAERIYHFSPPDHQTPDGPQSSKARRTLNPLFVEWLMGWPIGWTNCASPVTGFSLWQQRMRGELSRLCSQTPEQASLF